MRNLIKQFSNKFCTLIKDQVYEFDRSAISLCVRVNSLTQFNELNKLEQLGIRRIIYNLSEEAELMEFLAEHNDEKAKAIFDFRHFLFKGITFNVQTVMRENKIRKLENKALLQASQHIFQLKGKDKHNFQIYLGLEHKAASIIDSEFLLDLKENLDDLESVIENSFNFEVNHVLKWNPNFAYEQLFQIANQQKTVKSVDLDVFKYANSQSSEIDQNRQILATFYQNASEHYNTLFIRNFALEGDYIEQQDINEGIVSYSHFVDMLKMMHFRGTLVIDYNKHIEKNIKFLDQLLLTNKYLIIDKPELNDSHEEHVVNNNTDTIIDI